MRVAIQGEIGSNSHMAAVALLEGLRSQTPELGSTEILACAISQDALGHVLDGTADGAVLPIENSLHGSVAEHYDLLLDLPVRIVAESTTRIGHNVIALPGVRMGEIRRVFSHPVALSQCRRWLGEHREIEVVPFYDTAGGVKHVVREGLKDAAAIAPLLAAKEYGAEVLQVGIEDNAENYTRFHLIVRGDRAKAVLGGNKMSVAFSVDHRPGTLVRVLERLSGAGVNLTMIESRPVPGRPWEYVFYVDGRFAQEEEADAALDGIRRHTRLVKELGRYRAAEVVAGGADFSPAGVR